jgi:hypothetical protein
MRKIINKQLYYHNFITKVFFSFCNKKQSTDFTILYIIDIDTGQHSVYFLYPISPYII